MAHHKKMYSLEIIVLIITPIISTGISQTFPDSGSKFRILAPQFICPKDENAIIEKSDNTVITLQTAEDTELNIKWTVRWMPLIAPTQRFTLMLWRTVRTMEKQLNRQQPEPYVYVIENSELLRGVNYIFNVSTEEDETNHVQPKTFNIDNTQGDQKLMIEGRNDMLSIILVGAQIANADTNFAIDAQVTTCYATQDYYYSWTVMSVDSDFQLNVTEVLSSRIEIPPFSLQADLIYNINCKIIRHSNGDLITQTNLPFKVSKRGLNVYLNVDYLIVSANKSFSLESTVISHDYYDVDLTYKWQIMYQEEDCDCVDSIQNSTLTFPDGLPFLGEYKVILTVIVLDQMSETSAIVVAVANNLPIIQIEPTQRILNAGSEVTLVANASNVTPTCTLSWYFAPENTPGYQINNTCDNCEHGEPLSDTLTIFSLEEQFLSELTDFTNDTEWRQVTTVLPASVGRARFAVQCGCSLTFSCDTLGVVHGDVWFQVNESPKAGDVMLSPETGTALENMFRISTLAVTDSDTPLQYTFYCKVDEEETLLLATYFEHRAVETLLPYVVGGIQVWAEVCDALGACSNGNTKKIILTPGEGRTVDALITDMVAHVRRCELHLLQRVAISAIVTYTNNQQSEPLSKFSEALKKYLSTIDKNCIARNTDKYSDLVIRLEKYGIDINN